jgi:uncharacterized membrane protein YedE/YeeE
MKLVAAYAIGLIFGLGISISGMANPAKVVNFFDVAGSWDPSLAFVMGGALLVAFVGFRVVLRRPAPALADAFQLPTRRDLDARLLGGSAVFGIGWGIAGFCPGGALPALGTGVPEVFVFVAAASVGILAARLGPTVLRGRRAAA